jgi:cupin superfamily acireductone dioxygenase involved in methionine salvage
MEKRLISKKNSLPFSLTLKKFPKTKELTSEEGYKIHAHPALEIGYIIEGRIIICFEDTDVKEFQ